MGHRDPRGGKVPLSPLLLVVLLDLVVEAGGPLVVVLVVVLLLLLPGEVAVVHLRVLLVQPATGAAGDCLWRCHRLLVIHADTDLTLVIRRGGGGDEPVDERARSVDVPSVGFLCLAIRQLLLLMVLVLMIALAKLAASDW